MCRSDLWNRTVEALVAGDFSRLGRLLDAENASLAGLVEAYDEQRRYRNDALACACFLGRTAEAERLVAINADPADCRTGQTGFHYAVMAGHLDTVRMLIANEVPVETRNVYGGTVLGQALWSAVHEYREAHPEIIEALVRSGAEVEPGTTVWWSEQTVEPADVKERVLEILRGAEPRPSP